MVLSRRSFVKRFPDFVDFLFIDEGLAQSGRNKASMLLRVAYSWARRKLVSSVVGVYSGVSVDVVSHRVGCCGDTRGYALTGFRSFNEVRRARALFSLILRPLWTRPRASVISTE